MTDTHLPDPIPPVKDRLSFLSDFNKMMGVIALIFIATFIAVVVLNAFGVKLDADIKQTVIALTMIAAGVYLGTSTGSKSKDEKIAAKPPPQGQQTGLTSSAVGRE